MMNPQYMNGGQMPPGGGGMPPPSNSAGPPYYQPQGPQTGPPGPQPGGAPMYGDGNHLMTGPSSMKASPQNGPPMQGGYGPPSGGAPPPMNQGWAQRQPAVSSSAGPTQIANQMNGLNISGPNMGPPMANQRPPVASQGSPMPGPPSMNQAHPVQNQGPVTNQGPPVSYQGQSMTNQRPQIPHQAPPMSHQGPMVSSQAPQMGSRPPGMQQGPPTSQGIAGAGQRPQFTQVPPPSSMGLPPVSQYPQTSNSMPGNSQGYSPAGGPPMSGHLPPTSSGMVPQQGMGGPPMAPPTSMPGGFPPGPVPRPGMPSPTVPSAPPANYGGMPPPRPHMGGGPPPMSGGFHPMGGQGSRPMAGGPPPMSGQGPMGGQSMPPPPINAGPQVRMNLTSDSPIPHSGMQQASYPPPMQGEHGGYPPPPGPGAPYGPPGGVGMGPGRSMADAARSGGAYQPAASQQPKRLDPDQMPSPIQVMEDDRRNRGGLFQTGQRGIVPPLITTSFIAEDQGACNPRFMRSTMYNVPCTADMLKQSHLPFVLTVVPFARLHPKEVSPPIVDLGEMGPVRCNRCKAYMCPYMMFIDGGRKFQCSFCGCSTEVPPEYFAHLDHTGRRMDCYERPELSLGAYEFVATKDYCKDSKLPNVPAYIFMIDVSYNSVRSGLVDLICARLKDDVLSCLPKDVGDDESEIRVGFVTYAKELHFYNIKSTLSQPQMLVVSDVNDVFVPLLDGFFVKVSEAAGIIDSLLTQISQTFSESRETELVLGPVIQAGLDALKSAERAGKLIIFHTSLPSAEAPGKLVNRDDRKLLGTDKEKTILTSQTNFYTKLAQECVSAGCSVDLFLFPNSYIDVASVTEVSRLTGGSVYKYTYFQSDLDGDIFINDLITNVSRPIAFDAVLRVRTSTGIRAVDFHGNFYMSNTTDVELAALDCDKAVTVEIKHDDKLSEAEGAYVQAAMLYTSVGGRRRLRILNSAFNCCTQIADMFRNCELDVLINHMAKQAIRESLNTNSKQTRDMLMNECAQILACYRKNCASPSSSGQLILPECMKLLPVYVNCVLKSTILQSVDITTDDRSYAMFLVNAMNVGETSVFFYPRLLPLHEVDVNATSLPTPIRCSYERLHDNGVYLLENGMIMFIWVGLAVNVEWVRSVFNVPSAAQIDIDKTRLAELDNPLSRRIKQIVRRVREERHRHMKLIIVRQRDKLEPVFQQYLMEDRGSSGASSYVDFLCHIHKEIRNILN